MTEALVLNILDRLQTLRSARGLFEQHWQDLGEVMLPRRADFVVQTEPGEKRTQRQFDSVPMMASRGLASAIDAMIKPKSERWFNVRASDHELNELDEARLWFEDTEDRMYAAIYAPRARFLQSSGEVDIDLVVFGSGVLFIGLTRNRRSLNFRALHLKNGYFASNADGQIDTAFLVDRLTARQALQRFGDETKLGEKTREALNDAGRKDDKFTFVEAIMPRRDRDPRRRDNRNMPVTSIVVDIDSEHLVDEGGYHEFPLATPRWDTAAGEDYGRSPGMLALPDCSTLHEMGRTLLAAGHLAVDPPLLAASDSIISGARTFHGGITYFDAQMAIDMGRIPVVPLDTGKNLPIGLEMQESTREQVFMAFFRNVLNLPFGGPQMTATEVLERREEFVRAIGPVFGRLESDYLAPIVDRVFNLMMRAGAFAPPPEILQGQEVKFEYRSPIEQVRLQSEPMTVMRTMETLAPILPLQPEIIDQLDGDQITRDVALATGMRQSWLRPLEAVAALRQARAEEQAQAEQTRSLIEGAQAVADIAGKVPPELLGATGGD
jgi:hypothetical protein